MHSTNKTIVVENIIFRTIELWSLFIRPSLPTRHDIFCISRIPYHFLVEEKLILHSIQRKSARYRRLSPSSLKEMIEFFHCIACAKRRVCKELILIEKTIFMKPSIHELLIFWKSYYWFECLNASFPCGIDILNERVY